MGGDGGGSCGPVAGGTWAKIRFCLLLPIVLLFSEFLDFSILLLANMIGRLHSLRLLSCG